MKLLILSFSLTVLTLAGFVIGILSQATALTLAAFCAWTPVIFVFGFAFARSGIRIVADFDYSSAAPMSPVGESVTSRLNGGSRIERPVRQRER